MMRAVRLIAATTLLLLMSTSLANASPLTAVRNVTIAGFAFVPATIPINAGDSVTWTNTDAATHTATSNTGAFDTGQLAQGQSRTIPFTTAGTFAYHCAIHTNMTGTVVVQAVATPPPPPPATPPPATPPPTPRATAAPTAPPQTAEPTPIPTPTPISTAQPSPTDTPTPAASAAASATIVAAVPSAPAPSAAPAVTTGEGGPGPLLVAAGVVVIVALVGTAVVLLRR